MKLSQVLERLSHGLFLEIQGHQISCRESWEIVGKCIEDSSVVEFVFIKNSSYKHRIYTVISISTSAKNVKKIF